MAEEIKVAATETADAGKDQTKEPSQESNQRTEAEKAAFNLKKHADRAKELGLKPEDILGIKPKLQVDASVSDDTPLTVGALREIQKQDAKKTALQLAENIEDEDERTQTKNILERLAPSGDAEADLAIARSAVNAKRTSQIAADVVRTTRPNRTAAGGSANARQEDDFKPTEEELALFQGFKLDPVKLKDKILAARARAQK